MQAQVEYSGANSGRGLRHRLRAAIVGVDYDMQKLKQLPGHIAGVCKLLYSLPSAMARFSAAARFWDAKVPAVGRFAELSAPKASAYRRAYRGLQWTQPKNASNIVAGGLAP